jgi:hypothetical protein
MIRLCDGADDFSQDESGMPCRCGRRYDDVDRSTVWPHDVLPPAGPVIRAGSPGAGALLDGLTARLREVGRGRG